MYSQILIARDTVVDTVESARWAQLFQMYDIPGEWPYINSKTPDLLNPPPTSTPPTKRPPPNRALATDDTLPKITTTASGSPQQNQKPSVQGVCIVKFNLVVG